LSPTTLITYSEYEILTSHQYCPVLVQYCCKSYNPVVWLLKAARSCSCPVGGVRLLIHTALRRCHSASDNVPAANFAASYMLLHSLCTRAKSTTIHQSTPFSAAASPNIMVPCFIITTDRCAQTQTPPQAQGASHTEHSFLVSIAFRTLHNASLSPVASADYTAASN
jgi:hypothetical protein